MERADYPDRPPGSNGLQTASYKFEFGKRFNVQPVYVALMSIAHGNNKRLNG